MLVFFNLSSVVIINNTYSGVGEFGIASEPLELEAWSMAHFNDSKLCMTISLIIYLKQCARVRIYTTTKTKKAFHFFIETNCDLLNYFNIIE